MIAQSLGRNPARIAPAVYWARFLACETGSMQTFKARRVEGVDHPSNLPGQGQTHGMRAPGRVVMVVQEGSCWVRLQDSTRKNLTAKSVVIWEPGEWVEHGSITGEGYKTESYWTEDLSEEEWQAVFAETFRPDAVR